MTSFANIEEALQTMRDEAAADAWDWLEREKPSTASAIRYLVEVAKLHPDEVTKTMGQIYGVTEPKVQHKMRIVIEAIGRGTI